MRKKLIVIPGTALAVALAIGATLQVGQAADHRDGDTDKLGESLQHLEEHLAKAVEEEEITPEAADAVDTAISDIGVALQNEGALAVVPTPAPTGPTGETSGGKEDKHGSPPYGEANGHDED